MNSTGLVLALMWIAVLAVACSNDRQAPPVKDDAAATTTAGPPTSADSAAIQGVDMTLKSQPDPPRVGDNTFEVMVTAGGQPVIDAQLSVELFMAAMPGTNTPEGRTKVAVEHEGGGRYRGIGNVTVAGDWDVKVTATRSGQEVGIHTFKIRAK
jgi:hypothetical protein